MTSRMGRPARMPLSEPALRDAVLTGSRLFTSLRVLPRTGSTNADLLAAARAGRPAGPVLIAEEQTSGRGRLDRSWQSQPGAALTFSVLLRPAGVPPASRGWLALLAGVGVASALRAQTGLDVGLKWPNDVLCGGAKLAGILAEQAADAIVVGIGVNVSAEQHELPSERATSLVLQGAADPDRQAILVAILREIERWYLRFAEAPQPGDAAGSGLRAEYLRCCLTVGREVRVQLPGGGVLSGRAGDVDGMGRLLVRAAEGVQAVSAGDVIHVR
jgi:BirA family transcriptional regulator, biotin operon repressor / biotin---[acetyl-CoA-carboxylase] ligase